MTPNETCPHAVALIADCEQCRGEASVLNFGDLCVIEQKRFGVPNEFYLYKVVTRLWSNAWRPVPVSFDGLVERGEITEIILAIRCGVDESKVERFRVQDVRPANEKADKLREALRERDEARALLALEAQGKVTTHACPPKGEALTPCCGRAPFELPRTDRLSVLAGQVNCDRVRFQQERDAALARAERFERLLKALLERPDMQWLRKLIDQAEALDKVE